MRILVDLDGVLADWNRHYDEHLDAAGERGRFIPRRHEQSDFNLNAGRTDDEKALIASIMIHPGFYANLEPIPGGRLALRSFRNAGHEVFLVTSPWISNPTCASDKINWVAKHIGQSFAQRTIITTDKTVVDGDILIDDKPEVKGAATPRWEHILFDQPWNRSVTGKRRILDWANALEELP